VVTFELRKSFSYSQEFRSWEQAERENIAGLKTKALAAIEAQGYEEPITGMQIQPDKIRLVRNNLHESIGCNELNSRKRALLLAFERAMTNDLDMWPRKAAILSADGISRVALILRGRYPFFLGTEYLPAEEDQRKFFPVPHLDLQKIDHADESFDAFLSGDVFEHIPDLDQALAEITRVLKPGGLLVSSFPFSPDNYKTQIRATLSASGELEHHLPPEYHGNPVDLEAGSLVFSVPGWDILDKLRALGFESARFDMIASERFGILSDRTPGPFILVAKKAKEPAPEEGPIEAASISSRTGHVPRKAFVSLFGLPRSGTTLLTSIFASHPNAHTVFEPWNSQQVPLLGGTNLAEFARHLDLDIAGKDLLVVKETSTRQTYIDNLMALEAAYRSVTNTLPILIIRNPLKTFLSEVRRRNEWWDNPTKLDQAAFDNWCAKSRTALEKMRGHVCDRSGVIVTLEALSANSEGVLRMIMARTGVPFENRQLEYHKHLDLKLVRGDQNIQQAPAEISLDKANTNEEQMPVAEVLMAASPYCDWVQGFQAFWQEENNRLSALPAV
jgi:SAM-dependent methyltransferase